MPYPTAFHLLGGTQQGISKRSLAGFHNEYAVDLHEAVSIMAVFRPRPVLRIGEEKEEATAAHTWRWRPWKILLCGAGAVNGVL